jgi:hypothetical protein
MARIELLVFYFCRLGVSDQHFADAQHTSSNLQTLQQRAQNAYKRLDATELGKILAEAHDQSLILSNERELKGIVLMPEVRILHERCPIYLILIPRIW